MQPVYDVVTNGTGVDLNRLLHTVEDGGGISTTVDANETMSDMENPPFLKQPLHMVIIYTLAYSAVFILGVCGNALIIWIICSSPQMRTVTNYFIVNLASADILICLVCLPITLLTNLFSGWSYGAFLCKATPFLQGVSVNASVSSLMAIAIDRYLAICHGMRCHLTRKLARVTIVLIWTFAAAVMSPWAVFYRLFPVYSPRAANHESATTAAAYGGVMSSGADHAAVAAAAAGADHDEQTADDEKFLFVCNQVWPSKEVERVYFLAVIFVTCYTIPLLCITACYVMIGRRVCNRHALGAQGPVGSSGQTVIQRSKVKVVKMLVTVVAVFAVSWLPVYVVRLHLYWSALPDDDSLEFKCLVQVIIPVTQWAGLANSCVNPFIYCFFSNKFRSGFHRLLSARFCSARFDSSASTSDNSFQWRQRSSRMCSFSLAASGGNTFDHSTAIFRRNNPSTKAPDRQVAAINARKTSSAMSDVIVFSTRAREFVLESTAL